MRTLRRASAVVYPVLASNGAILAIAAALTAACLIAGAGLYLSGRQEGLPDPGAGMVSVLTNDPTARVRVHQSLTAAGLDYLPVAPLSLDVSIATSRTRPLRWAILLTEDFALPFDGVPSGDALPRGHRRRLLDVWVDGTSTKAWYIRDAGLLRSKEFGPTPTMLASVLLGEATPRDGVIEVSVVGPTKRPLIDDVGDRYQIALPVLGLPFYGSESDVRRQARRAGDRALRLAVAERHANAVPTSLRHQLERTVWRLPSRQAVSAEVFDHSPGDRMTSASVAPESFSEWRWKDPDRLEIVAIVERPSVAARKARREFFAALLLGLGGGFVAWTLELLHQRARLRTRSNAQ